MIEVTPKAVEFLTDYFKDKKKEPIRIFLRIGGCGMRSFGVTLEGPTNADQVFDQDGFQYVIEKRLITQFQPIRVDSDGVGFRLSGSGIYPPSGCGNCGYMCGIRGGYRCSGNCATCAVKCSYGYKSARKNKAKQV